MASRNEITVGIPQYSTINSPLKLDKPTHKPGLITPLLAIKAILANIYPKYINTV